jgi:hypothetical protein
MSGAGVPFYVYNAAIHNGNGDGHDNGDGTGDGNPLPESQFVSGTSVPR